MAGGGFGRTHRSAQTPPASQTLSPLLETLSRLSRGFAALSRSKAHHHPTPRFHQPARHPPRVTVGAGLPRQRSTTAQPAPICHGLLANNGDPSSTPASQNPRPAIATACPCPIMEPARHPAPCATIGGGRVRLMDGRGFADGGKVGRGGVQFLQTRPYGGWWVCSTLLRVLFGALLFSALSAVHISKSSSLCSL